LVTAGAAPTPSAGSANAIEQVKLERIMAMFQQMTKSDNLCSMIQIVMHELRSLIPAASIAFFVVNDRYSKDLQDLETLSKDTGTPLFYQKFMVDQGRMIEAICNVVGEIKTAFTDPNKVKFGLKEAQYLVQAAVGGSDEVDAIIQCTSKVNRQNKFVGFSVAEE